MTSLNGEAIIACTEAVSSLLPHLEPPFLPVVQVNSQVITPAGVGGFVGFNDKPYGEIRGRRLEAGVTITVQEKADPNLQEAITLIIGALVGAEREQLLLKGIQRVALKECGPVREASNGVKERDVMFTVLFEYLKKPVEGEGIIKEIPLHVDEG